MEYLCQLNSEKCRIYCQFSNCSAVDTCTKVNILMSMSSGTLKQRARDQLLEKLARGQWRPGVRVSELKLAREMGTSRGPVREAVNQLTSQGILDHIPGFGSFIKVPTPREMEDLYEFREAMESHAAFLAAKRINAAQLMVLRKTLE